MTGALLVLAAALAGCGVERQAEKTLADPLASHVNRKPKPIAIAALVALPAPKPPVAGHEPRGVRAEEFETYTIEGTITVAKREADQDIHIAVSDGAGHSLVVESVYPPCARGSIALDQIKAVRQTLIEAVHGKSLSTAEVKHLVGRRVRVSGPAFFDVHTKAHSPDGSAANGIELHPVTSLEVLP